MAEQHDADDLFEWSALIRHRSDAGEHRDARTLEQELRDLEARQRLHNRLALGEGVLCGLRLGVGPEGLLKLSPGVAIDPMGREIVVPEGVTIDPHKVTDETGAKARSVEEGTVTVALAYHAKPLERGRDEEGSYAVLVLLQHRDAPESHAWPKTGRRAQTRESLARIFAEIDEAPCAAPKRAYVILGQVTLARGRALAAGCLSTEGRTMIASNARLLEIVTLLWQRLEDCLGIDRPTPTPVPLRGPAAPTPTPPPYLGPTKDRNRYHSTPGKPPAGNGKEPGEGPTLRVVGVEFLDAGGRPVGTLDEKIRPFRFGVSGPRQVAAIGVTFSRPIDKASCSARQAESASIQVRADWGRGRDGHVPGLVSVQGSIARVQLDEPGKAFPAGRYEVTIFGNDDTASGRRGVSAADNGARLDGEPRTLPSGDGHEGGDFVFRMHLGDGDA